MEIYKLRELIILILMLVQWSVIHLILNIILANGWHTKQIYDKISGFRVVAIILYVLQVLNNLYGLKLVLQIFFNKLKAGLIEHTFVQYHIDHCLFIEASTEHFLQQIKG